MDFGYKNYPRQSDSRGNWTSVNKKQRKLQQQSVSTSVDGQDREQGANESIFYGKEP